MPASPPTSPKDHNADAPTFATHGEPLMQSLAERYKSVSDLTQQCYSGDVVPPSTKSQVLPAQKFAVLYYYLVNGTFFAYAFLIPLFVDGPYYGGLDVHDFHGNGAHLTIICIVFTMVLVRFVVMSWTAEFYHFAILLAGFEIACISFTVCFWSYGLPVLLVLFVANFLNIVVSQIYWKSRFHSVVANLPTLVPPSAPHVKDHTATLFSLNISGQVWTEFVKLLGFEHDKNEAILYDERCGVFGTKNQMSHVQALHCAYMQALNPTAVWAPWPHGDNTILLDRGVLSMLQGLLRTFISNATYCFAGFWLGKVLLQDWSLWGYAVPSAATVLIMGIFSVRRTLHWLEEALGVAVAEKEWLAFDIVKHSAQREEMTFDVLDVNGSAGTLKEKVMNPQFMQTGRSNMVFMWLCVASVADFIGEAYLAKVYWRVALQTRYMMEALTPYDFRLFEHAKWEVTYKGTFIKAMQNLILVFISCIYFGNYFMPPDQVPVPLMAVIGAASFIQSIMSITEAVQFAFTILGDGKTTHRHKYVSEWVVVISLLSALTNVLIWLYLLPIMKQWNLPVGRCKSKFNQYMFASACFGRS